MTTGGKEGSMSASPLLRITFEDGSTWEVRWNVWAWFPPHGYHLKGRFGQVGFNATPGRPLCPDGPQGPTRVVRSVERLPYKTKRGKNRGGVRDG